MGTPHKHAEVIKAWADGAKIQIKLPNGAWSDIKVPDWNSGLEYRVKPEPKETYVLFYKNLGSGSIGVTSFNTKDKFTIGLGNFKKDSYRSMKVLSALRVQWNDDKIQAVFPCNDLVNIGE